MIGSPMTEKMEAEEFLWNIEHDPDSFTEGRRNDDLVNWALAKIMVLQEQGLDIKAIEGYDILGEWRKVRKTLTDDQQTALDDFDYEDSLGCDGKVRTCWEYYSETNDPSVFLIDQGGYKETYKKEGN